MIHKSLGLGLVWQEHVRHRLLNTCWLGSCLRWRKVLPRSVVQGGCGVSGEVECDSLSRGAIVFRQNAVKDMHDCATSVLVLLFDVAAVMVSG